MKKIWYLSSLPNNVLTRLEILENSSKCLRVDLRKQGGWMPEGSTEEGMPGYLLAINKQVQTRQVPGIKHKMATPSIILKGRRALNSLDTCQDCLRSKLGWKDTQRHLFPIQSCSWAKDKRVKDLPGFEVAEFLSDHFAKIDAKSVHDPLG